MRDVYGATSEKAQWLRFHTQTAGVSLTAQQPYNNVVRTAVEALAAVLGGTNSLHTNALDETLALPSEQAAEIALRTQQVLMEETGVANVADPLGGSWYVEALTDRIEADAEKIFEQIKERGRRAVPGRAAPHRADHLRHPARHRGRLVHRRDRRGRLPRTSGRWRRATRRSSASTATTGSVTGDLEILRVSHEVEREQVRALARAARPRATTRAVARRAGRRWSRPPGTGAT